MVVQLLICVTKNVYHTLINHNTWW